MQNRLLFGSAVYVLSLIIFCALPFSLHAQTSATIEDEVRAIISADVSAKKIPTAEREGIITGVASIMESRGINPRDFTATGMIELLLISAQQQKSPEGSFARTGQDIEPVSEITADSGGSCFDYYTFGSVQADVRPSVLSALAGTPITFSGFLHNDNPYPLVEGSLYVKVFRVSGATKNANGPAVVDQFFVLDDIRIQPGDSIPIKFIWNVPAYAESGEYELATFFTTSRKFNLLGLSFTDDVIGNKAHFSVKSEAKGGVSFDKQNVQINKKPYFFAAFPPRVHESAPVIISAPIVNSTKETAEVSVTWKLYRWDAQRHTNMIDEQTETLSLKNSERRVLEFTVENAEYPVYLVEGELRFKDTASFINVRFVRQNHDALRLNFPGVMRYPLVQGVPNTIFSCAHNTGSSYLVRGGAIELVLTDASGDHIDSYRYEGGVTGPMMVVKKDFVPKATYDTFTLTARLFQDGTLIEEESIAYVCTEFGLAGCLPRGKSTTPFFSTMSGGEVLSLIENEKGFIVIPTIMTIVFLGILFVFIRVRQKIN